MAEKANSQSSHTKKTSDTSAPSASISLRELALVVNMLLTLQLVSDLLSEAGKAYLAKKLGDTELVSIIAGVRGTNPPASAPEKTDPATPSPPNSGGPVPSSRKKTQPPGLRVLTTYSKRFTTGEAPPMSV